MLPDHNYAKRSQTENISDYEKLCKRFKITSINLELESTNEVPACPRSRDPSSETLPLLVREETQISISSDGLVLSPSLNEVNNNSQGSVSPGQQSVYLALSISILNISPAGTCRPDQGEAKPSCCP